MEQKKDRIVVTGRGVVSPIGIGLDPFWESLIHGRSGIKKLTSFDTTEFEVKIGGEITEFDPSQYMDRKDVKRTDRFVQFAIVATQMALEESGLKIDEGNSEQIGVLIGSGFGGLTTLMKEHEVLLSRGPNRVSPLLVPMMIADMASGYVSILTGAKGPNTTVVTACATGANAIGEGAEIIRRGQADAMIVGGTEACLHPLAFAGFGNAMAMTNKFNDSPTEASCPFDSARSGFVGAEGAGVLIIESESHALARGAKILAIVSGYGMSGDAHHMVQPELTGKGVFRAMRMALKSAGLEPKEIQYVNAHATSTQLGDKVETLAYKRLFGDHAYKVAISSTKSMTGHMLGAAGAAEAIVGIGAICNQEVPPTINHMTSDPECDLDYVPNNSRKIPVTNILSNNSGFGGHNATLIFSRYQPQA